MNTDKQNSAESNRVHWRPFAAATLLMLTAALLLLDDLWQPASTEVVAVPCAATLVQFDEQVGVNFELSRSDASTLLNSKGYFLAASSAQEARLEQALMGQLALAPTAHFNLALRPAVDSFALVLITDAAGRVVGNRNRLFEVAYPAGKSWTPTSGQLRGGELAVLPRRNLTWDQEHEPSASYDAGFLIPEGARRLQILTGLRGQALDNRLKQSLDSLLLKLSKSTHEFGQTSSQLRKWLRDAGFTVTATEVFGKRK